MGLLDASIRIRGSLAIVGVVCASSVASAAPDAKPGPVKQAPAATTPKPAVGEPDEKSFLFVGDIEISSTESPALRDLIDSKISVGLETAPSPRRFQDFRTSRSLKENERTLIPQIGILSEQLGVNYLAIGEKLARLSRGPKHWLRVNVSRGLDLGLRIRMDLYEFKSGTILKSKSIGGCGMSDQAVIDAVLLAARSIRQWTESAPQVIARSSHRDGIDPTGKVTLDGCGTVDPDFDALVYTWKQTGDTSNRILPQSGLVGERIELGPMNAGTYQVQLTVQQERGLPQEIPSDPVELRVFEPPRANAGESMIVRFDDKPVEIKLDASQSTPALGPGVSYVWRQLTGPLATFPDARGFCTKDICTVSASAPGVYVFQVEVRNGNLSSVSNVKVLVAAPPRVDFSYCAQSVTQAKTLFIAEEPTNKKVCNIVTTPFTIISLQAEVRADELDREPSLYWRLHDGKHDAVLSNPHSREPTFVASETGTYYVDVYARVRRQFGDRDTWEVGKRSAAIVVLRPNKTFFLAPAFEVPFYDRDPRFRLTFGIAHLPKPSFNLGYRLTGTYGSLKTGVLIDDQRWVNDLGVSGSLMWSWASGSVEAAPFLGYHVAGQGHFFRLEHGPEAGVQLTQTPFARWGFFATIGARYMFAYEGDHPLVFGSVGAALRDL